MPERSYVVALVSAFFVLMAVACGDTGTVLIYPSSSDADATDVTDPPAPTGPIIDLRVDSNRSGAIELDDPTEDDGEDTWDATHGAVFLANIDDDQSVCPTFGSDLDLPGCNDALDEVVNGANDLLDMGLMHVVAWPDAPDGTTAELIVSSPGDGYVRIFKADPAGNSGYSVFEPGVDVLGVEELRDGVDLRIEGIDIVRDPAAWDGYVNVDLNVYGPDNPLGADRVRMRVAPVMTYHHGLDVETLYAASFSYLSSTMFTGDLETALAASGIDPLFKLYVGDQWAQDYFEPGFMSMPGAGGAQHAIRINYRSANVTNPNGVNPLREAGKIVFTVLRGPDMAGIQQYDLSHPGDMDSLDSFGNLETIPPYSYGGEDFPMGRVFRGRIATFYPDEIFDTMVEAQGQQPYVTVDTSWLLVGHVDETVSFVPTDNDRGWTIMVNDPAMAVDMLEAEQTNGNGAATLFDGKYWDSDTPAQISIDALLADEDVMSETNKAIAEVGGQLSILMAATGVTDDELIKIPYTHYAEFGYSVAYQPGTVNGVLLNGSNFAAPDPHGPEIDGADLFKTQMSDALAPHGVTVHWVEDWDLYHRLLGEVHCGSNSKRTIPVAKWWESGR